MKWMLSDERTKEKLNGPPVTDWVSLIVLLLDHTNRSQWDTSAQICTFEQGTFPKYGKGTNPMVWPCHGTGQLEQEITFSTPQRPLSLSLIQQPAAQSEFPKMISSYPGPP